MKLNFNAIQADDHIEGNIFDLARAFRKRILANLANRSSYIYKEKKGK